MKLIRFGQAAKEKPGILLEDGTRLDVSSFGMDYDENFFANGGLNALREWMRSSGCLLRRSRDRNASAPLFAGPAKSCVLASTSGIMRLRLRRSLLPSR